MHLNPKNQFLKIIGEITTNKKAYLSKRYNCWWSRYFLSQEKFLIKRIRKFENNSLFYSVKIKIILKTKNLAFRLDIGI